MTGAFNPGVSRKMMPGMEQISTDLSAVPHASGIQRATAANRQIPAYAPRAIVDLAPNLFERDTRGSVNEPARPLLASVLHLEPGFIDLSTIADADGGFMRIWPLLALLICPFAITAEAGAMAACEKPGEPPYPPREATANVLTWRAGDLPAALTASECGAWIAARSNLVIALAGRFSFPGSADDLMMRFARLSAFRGIRYWSISDGRWETLIADASALDGGKRYRALLPLWSSSESESPHLQTVARSVIHR